MVEPSHQETQILFIWKIDEHNNKFGKVWSPVSELITGTNTSTLPELKIDLSDHPFIKYVMFKVAINFPPRGTPIGIIAQYFEHHNMYYIYQSTNNIPWYHVFTTRNNTNT